MKAEIAEMQDSLANSMNQLDDKNSEIDELQRHINDLKQQLIKAKLNVGAEFRERENEIRSEFADDTLKMQAERRVSICYVPRYGIDCYYVGASASVGAARRHGRRASGG